MSEKIRYLESKVNAIEQKLDVLSCEFKNAYNYLHSDPAGSLNKTRIVMEKILADIYKREMGKYPKKSLLGDILKDNQFTRKIERRILSRIHAIRDMANLGTHGENVIKDDAVDILDNLCKVLMWYFDKYLGISVDLGKIQEEKNIQNKLPDENMSIYNNQISFEQKRINELEESLANIESQKEEDRRQLKLKEIAKKEKQKKVQDEELKIAKEKKRIFDLENKLSMLVSIEKERIEIKEVLMESIPYFERMQNELVTLSNKYSAIERDTLAKIIINYGINRSVSSELIKSHKNLVNSVIAKTIDINLIDLALREYRKDYNVIGKLERYIKDTLK